MDTENPLEYITLPAGKMSNYARHVEKQTNVKKETYFEKVLFLNHTISYFTDILKATLRWANLVSVRTDRGVNK
jgi:hypothetical protein